MIMQIILMVVSAIEVVLLLLVLIFNWWGNVEEWVRVNFSTPNFSIRVIIGYILIPVFVGVTLCYGVLQWIKLYL